MRLAVLWLTGLLLQGSVVAAQADSCWGHNGSTMRLHSSNDQRIFRYEKPRSGLIKAGVRKGTLLFDGTQSGKRVRGTARLFYKGCATVEYRVTGRINNQGTRINMSGKVRWLNKKCIADHVANTDKLVFKLIGPC